MKRADDYQERRAHLANLSDAELEQRFWALAEQITEPLVDGCMERSLIAHGAGNVVFRLAKAENMDVRAAGLALCEDRLWDEAAAQF